MKNLMKKLKPKGIKKMGKKLINLQKKLREIKSHIRQMLLILKKNTKLNYANILKLTDFANMEIIVPMLTGKKTLD
jgi:hypothetical protein